MNRSNGAPSQRIGGSQQATSGLPVRAARRAVRPQQPRQPAPGLHLKVTNAHLLHVGRTMLWGSALAK
jgi:hypothetical protein